MVLKRKMAMKFKVFINIVLGILTSLTVHAQITAPSSSASFTTDYSSEYLNTGGINDNVYIFCGNQSQNNIGELQISAPGCSVSWYQYDGISFVAMGVTGETATGLESGFYMAQVNCSGSITCYRAWVWVNQTFVEIAPIAPGCQTFDLVGQVSALDSTFTINDPPGTDFIIDENSFIKVCFWANHTYVSDLGFYLKAPGFQAANPGENGVVQLCPAASDWGPNAEQGSWTGIPWSALGCSDANDENTVCNAGDNVGMPNQGFCFLSHASPGGPQLPAGTPALTPCVCDLPTPLKGNFASVGEWNTIYGSHAADPGWSVQIYDCEFADVGALTRATISIVGQTSCGLASFIYDSGPINSTINDISCDAGSASVYVVPPSTPGGTYTINSSIISTQWTSIPESFTSNQLVNTIDADDPNFPTESTEYILTVVETINAPGNPICTTTASETLITLPANATIFPVNPMCTNSGSVQLQAVSGGGTWSTNAPAGSLVNGYFYPDIAGPGTYTITYTILGECEDEDQITVTVYDNIQVVNFNANQCSGTNTEYYVSFNVVNSNNQPVNFYVNTGTGDIPYNGGSFIGTYINNSVYNITVTDIHNCSSYEFHGSTHCDCTTAAGNMTNINPIVLCEDEWTGVLGHDGTQQLDANDFFEFALHDGAYPPTIYARSNVANFSFSDLGANGNFGQTYYVSAICGNLVAGHVDINDTCFAQSIGVPVIWFENPVAQILTPESSICGLTITLEANPPANGMTGVWTANTSFVPVGGTSISSPVMNVLVQDFGEVTFTWIVSNSNCSSSDQVTVHFNQTPTAYAGENITVCGNQAQLNAIPSMAGAMGQWTGPGSFSSNTDPQATVMANAGTHVFTWRESLGNCWTEDYVSVTFLKNPSPTIINSFDTVCGNTVNLNVLNSQFAGIWKAYAWNETENNWEITSLYFEPNNYSPTASATTGNYQGLFRNVKFVWTETNSQSGLQCTDSAKVFVTFERAPNTVVTYDESEICGNTIQLSADTTGSGWATGWWIDKTGLASFENYQSPNTMVQIETPVSFGDAGYVKIPFVWVMRNVGCSVLDTAWVTFYQIPQANAGLDKIVCGLETDLQAYWSIAPNPSYTPDGVWSTVPKPGATATIQDKYNPNSHVTVSETGVWRFVFRERNTNNTSCISTDTVQIEFVETPIPFAGEDKHVCGKCVTLEATSGGFSGTWLPNGAEFDNTTDPHTNACVAAYDTIVFIWQEANPAITDPSFSCVAADAVNIIFWRVPSANILTDIEDSTVCGLTYYGLRSELQGTGITGYWYNYNSGVEFGDKFANNTWVKVPHYGYYDFYWIEQTGPNLIPGFCNDTAGPLRIHFIETPIANGGGDTLFCGLTGNLNAIPSVGTSTGTWSKPTTANITFADKNDPNTQITAAFNNTAEQPYYELIWTEDNTNDCTDRDTIKVTFARVPNSDITIIPPKCFGEPATIAAVEDSLAKYTWNFYTGILDSSVNNIQHGARYLNFVRWTGKDTIHRISLVAESSLGCQSPITVDTVYEPSIPDFDHIIVNDTCLLGKGGIIFEDTLGSNVFFWLDPDYGPNPGDAVTAVYNLPEGDYRVATSYMSPNIQHYEYYSITFGTTNCLDTLTYTVDPIGVIQAIIDVDPQMIYEELVAPNAKAIFINRSDYDDIRRRCEWHFDDGTAPQKTCDSIVEHIYTKSGCYEPFLIVMNRDLPECRDTARLDHCILVEEKSEIEVPNIFSPNGDGVNDFFQVKAQTLKEFKGVITNRWGRKVYEWTDWETYEAGWDGNINGGSKASPGVYYYEIKATGFDGNIYEEQGILHLMRE